jgi:hypothetical protein
MIDAVIATFPTQPAVLSGQSLMVRTVFDNRSAAPIQAPSQQGTSQFVYILRSQKEGGPVYGLSEVITFNRRSPDRVGSPPPETEALDAGGKIERMEDIADFWNEGFAPGKYWLTVEYRAGGLVSPKSEVTILPMDVQSFSSFATDGHLSSVLAHRRQDGRITLLQRESDVRDPREGVFLMRQVLPADGASVSVATSIDVVRAGSGRWIAWSHGGSLNAINAWGDAVVATAAPVPAEGVLLSPGFQVAVGTGLFGVVSSSGHLQTYLATREGLRKHWAADLGGASGKIHWNAQPDGSVVVAWEEAGGRVVRRSFGADGHPRESAPLPVTPGSPLAWGFPAKGAPTVWATAGDGSEVVVVRVAIAGERSMTRIPALNGAVGFDFHDATPGVAPIVAAIAGEKFYSMRLDAPVWRAVPDLVPRQALEMHVVSLNDRGMFAEWIEPGFGVRRAKLP